MPEHAPSMFIVGLRFFLTRTRRACGEFQKSMVNDLPPQALPEIGDDLAAPLPYSREMVIACIPRERINAQVHVTCVTLLPPHRQDPGCMGSETHHLGNLDDMSLSRERDTPCILPSLQPPSSIKPSAIKRESALWAASMVPTWYSIPCICSMTGST